MISKKKEGVVPGPGKAQCSSVGEYQDREMGRVDGGTSGGKRAYRTLGEWGARKGEIIWNINKKYIEFKKKRERKKCLIEYLPSVHQILDTIPSTTNPIQYKQYELVMFTLSIRLRCRISSCSLAFWKRACSLSSAEVSKYTSTSLVGRGVGGTETNSQREFSLAIR